MSQTKDFIAYIADAARESYEQAGVEVSDLTIARVTFQGFIYWLVGTAAANRKAEDKGTPNWADFKWPGQAQ